MTDSTVTEAIEGEAVEIDAPEPEAQPTTALAVFDASAGAIIRADQPEEILAKATTIANALKKLIDGQNLAASMGGGRKHVEVGAWQACGALLGALGGQALHAETLWTRPVGDGKGGVQRTTYTAEVQHYKWVNGQKQLASTTTYEVDGLDWEACVEVRTASGAVVGRAEAMVSRAEEKWSRRDDYALRSMAETRAESRAYRKAIGWIVHLAGYNPTPAEEMGHTPGADMAPAPPPEASAELKGTVRNVVMFLMDGNEPSAREALADLAKHFDAHLPAAAGQAIVLVGSAVKRYRENGPPAKPSDVPNAFDPEESARIDAAEAEAQLGLAEARAEG